MYVVEDTAGCIRRSPDLVMDQFTGSDDEMDTPRWLETLVLGEEYAIYDFRTVVTRLMFKLALRYSNLKEVSSSLAHFLFPNVNA